MKTPTNPLASHDAVATATANGLTLEQAREIAEEDPSLIYLEIAVPSLQVRDDQEDSMRYARQGF